MSVLTAPTNGISSSPYNEMARRLGGVLEEAVQHMEERIDALRAEVLDGGRPTIGQNVFGVIGDEILRKTNETENRVNGMEAMARALSEEIESSTKAIEVRFCKDLDTVKSNTAPRGIVNDLAAARAELKSEFVAVVDGLRKEFEALLSKQANEYERRFAKEIDRLISTIKSFPTVKVDVPEPTVKEVRVTLEQKPVRRDLLVDKQTGRTTGMIETPLG
jgi:hypothetical protein